jgi:hypothetical protein
VYVVGRGEGVVDDVTVEDDAAELAAITECPGFV